MEIVNEEQQQDINILKRALLVEDYVPCCKIMTHSLHKLGYQVDLAVDGITAIQNIQSKAYDLILADIRLSEISGRDVIQNVRDSTLNTGTPLIIWSAFVNQNNEEKYLAWGVDGVLIKACSYRQLKNTIQQCFKTPKYKRKFYFQLKILIKKWNELFTERTGLSADFVDRFKSILWEGLAIAEEYQQWLKFHTK